MRDFRLFVAFVAQLVDLSRTWRRDARSGPLAPRQWPIGPHYSVPFPGDAGWVHYKLGAAEWYWSTLRQLDGMLPELDRYVGVEMALDGCLASASSAIDAAVIRLLRSLADRRRSERTPIPATLQRSLFKADWSNVDRLAGLTPPITLRSQASARFELVDGISSLVEADRLIDERSLLEGQPPSASRDARMAELSAELGRLQIGPVAELRWLRNRSTHADTLVRRFYRGGGADTCHIRTPRGGHEAPVPYLRTMIDACSQLADDILADAAAVAP